MIKTADDLGFYACYSVDEIYHKDMWLLFAAAADKTRNIRMGPNVTHVILRDPTLIAQQLATLDELTGGRAEAVVSFGNLVMLSQYHVEWKGSRPWPGSGRACRSSGPCSTPARSTTRASSSSTRACSPPPGRSRSGCR